MKDQKMVFKGHWVVKCKDKEGNLLWEEEMENLIPNAWLNAALDILFNLGSQPTSMNMGLVNGPSPSFAATDTISSHPGWTENTDYSEASRPAWNPDAASGEEVENPTPLSFSMNPGAPVSISGLFIITENPTKGNFSSGIIVSEVLFAQGTKSVADGDTLEVTYKYAASSGS